MDLKLSIILPSCGGGGGDSDYGYVY